MQKQCFKCGVAKELSEFYKHKAMKDGHLNKCKACAKNDVTNHRNNHLDRIREYDRQRGRTHERIQRNQEYTSIRRQKFPWKYYAYNKVSGALRSGKLIKQPCAVCGSAQSEAHHEDYSKPLEVTWLCKIHHEKRHSEIGDFLVRPFEKKGIYS